MLSMAAGGALKDLAIVWLVGQYWHLLAPAVHYQAFPPPVFDCLQNVACELNLLINYVNIII